MRIWICLLYTSVRYFDKMYAKRLRTYRKTGFSIWTQELQPKQIINAIFDSVNYTEKFEQDIVESEKMVVISSPDIRQDKIDRFLLLIKKRQEVGVKVTVITTDPEAVSYTHLGNRLISESYGERMSCIYGGTDRSSQK